VKTSEVLIFGKDEIGGQFLKDRFGGNGFKIIETLDQSEAFQIVKNQTPAIVIITSVSNDIKNGLHSVRQIRRINGTIPIIMISRYSSEDNAISAFRAGVTDYFKVPFRLEDVVQSVTRCLNGHASLSSPRSEKNDSGNLLEQKIIGTSKSMQEIRAYLNKVAATDTTVLITGETGTGKELVAELIHRCSPKSDKPFVPINCAALPESLVESELFGYDRGAFTGAVATKPGKFELAAGGSVFLDEIGDMSSFAQAKILRTIENKEVIRLGGKKNIPLEVRVIAATNQDPEELVAFGKFREDLYYRLNVVRLHLPPLRKRKEDIPCLAAHAITKLNQRYQRDISGLTEETLAHLMRYDWPGNVRELINLFEAVYVYPLHKKIDFSNLPLQFRRTLQKSNSTTDNERGSIVSTLISTHWKKAEAASKLKWSRMTLYRKIIKYKIVEQRNPSR
jgi:DNA-binding NtrC family response regulator